jgi:hypothetical protein
LNARTKIRARCRYLGKRKTLNTWAISLHL